MVLIWGILMIFICITWQFPINWFTRLRLSKFQYGYLCFWVCIMINRIFCTFNAVLKFLCNLQHIFGSVLCRVLEYLLPDLYHIFLSHLNTKITFSANLCYKSFPLILIRFLILISEDCSKYHKIVFAYSFFYCRM